MADMGTGMAQHKNFLFVHGTGVRGSDFDASYAMVREQAAAYLPGITVRPCRWGEVAGVQPLENPGSVPSYEVGRSSASRVSDLSTEESQTVRWGLLYQDPLYEFRTYAALATGDDLGGDLVLAEGGGITVPEVRKQLSTLEVTAGAIARAGHLAVELRRPAIDLICGETTLADALATDHLRDVARCRPMLARAFVGAWMLEAENRRLPALDGELRDRLYEDAVNALGGPTMGLKDEVLGAVAGIATWAGRRRRTQLTDGTYFKANDVLLYQSPHGGRAIRLSIENHLRDLDGPTVILAHSLGGIASVELMVSTVGLPVTALITCGSQAPFLYEADVLGLLRRDMSLPEHFPPWLNIYDPNDFLSYCAEPVFPGRAKDVEVFSRQPFPQSHSAYWASERVWQHIKAFLA